MMVIFLVGLVSMILMRTLRKDYARYSKDDELDDLVSLYTCTTLFEENDIMFLQAIHYVSTSMCEVIGSNIAVENTL